MMLSFVRRAPDETAAAEPTRKIAPARVVTDQQISSQRCVIHEGSGTPRRFLRWATLLPSPLQMMLPLGAVLAQLNIPTARGAQQGGMV
jgi:hypothetical protein